MIDVAKLGIVIDTSQVRSAANDLNVWSVEAARAEKITGAAARAVDNMSGKLRIAGGVIAKANSQVSNLGASHGNAANLIRYPTGTFDIAQKQVAATSSPVQAPASDAGRRAFDFSQPTGYADFDYIRSRASQAGEPLRKSDIQEAGETIHWLIELLGPLIRDARVKMADHALTELLQGTDFNKQAEVIEKLSKDAEIKKKRSESNGDRVPTLKTDAADAEERLEFAKLVYDSRMSVTEKYEIAAANLGRFQKNNFLADMARVQANMPEGNLYEFAAPFENLINGLQHMTAIPEDVAKVTDGLSKAAAKPENAKFALGLKEMLTSWETTSKQVTTQLQSIRETRDSAKSSVANYMSGNGNLGNQADVKSAPDAKAIEQMAASKLGEWAANSSNFKTALNAVAGMLVPSFWGTAKDIRSQSQNNQRVTDTGIYDVSTQDRAASSHAKLERHTNTLTEASRTYVNQTKRSVEATNQSTSAADRLDGKVVTLKQSQDELQKSCAMQLAQMPQLTKAANDQADAYRRVADAQALQKLAGDIQFQQDQMGRSTVDQTVASTQKQYGLPVDMNSASANIIRYNEQLKYARELAGDFASTLVSGLRNGEGLWKSLGKAAISVLTKISDRLLNDVLNSLFKVNSAAAGGGLFGGGGIGGIFSNLFGFGGGGGFNIGSNATVPTSGFDPFSALSAGWADGGYTGPGGVYDPAGLVHAGEVVWSQKDIARAGGVGVVEAMRLGRRGYADGGVVGEGGPQLVRAQPDAAVPVRRLRADNQNDASGSASGVHVTVGVSVDEDGNLKAYVKNVAQSEAQSSTRQGLNDFNQQLPDRVAQINRNPRRR